MEHLRITFVIALGGWKAKKIHYFTEITGKALSEGHLNLCKPQMSEILLQTMFYFSSFLPAMFCPQVFSPSLLSPFPHFIPHCYSQLWFLAGIPPPL